MSSTSALLEEGVIFVRGRVAEVTDVARGPAKKGKLIIQVEDTLVGKQRRIPVDMVILSAGLEPRHDAKQVAKLFGISCSADGWFIEKHPKLDPVATMTEGIFIAGCVQGPKDIPASVAQGAAAAARVLGRIQQKEIALEPVRAIDRRDECSGCRICNNLCPFNAILFHEDRRCRRSTRRCARAAARAWPPARRAPSAAPVFSNEQVLAQIEGLLLLQPAAGDGVALHLGG